VPILTKQAGDLAATRHCAVQSSPTLMSW